MSRLRPGLSEAERATMTGMAPGIREAVVGGEGFRVAGQTEPGGGPGPWSPWRPGATSRRRGTRTGVSRRRFARPPPGRAERPPGSPVGQVPAGRHAGPVGRYMTVGERLTITM